MATGTAPRTKTFDPMKLAICVGIGAALGIVLDLEVIGIPSAAWMPALAVFVAQLWSRPERAAARREAETSAGR